MIRLHTRALLWLLLFFGAGFVFFFIDALHNFPAEYLLPMYKTAWLFDEALRSLIEHLPDLAFSAILVAFASLQTENTFTGSSSVAISKPVSKTLVLFIFLTLIYSALTIGLLPVLWEHRQDRLYSSTLAEGYLSQAQEAEEAGDLEQAYENYLNYLQIDRENRQVKEAVNHLEGQITIRKAEAKASLPEKVPPARTQYRNMTAVELLKEAEESLNNEDPFTAHYLAGIVLDMNDSREDAKQLAARAMQEIESLEPSRQQKEEYDIYRRKVKGYEALTHQRPIEAYYTFKKLKEEVHADRDIDKYYQISLEETRGVSYFIDEAEMTRTLPGIEQIVYIDRNPSLNVNEGETIVYIDNLVQDAGTFWAHGVEIMSLSDEMDTPSFHLQADYGKLVNNTLMLKGIYRDDPEKTLEPSFYSAEQLPEVSTVFTLTPSIVQLVRLSRQQDFLHQLNLPDLIQILPEIETFGYPPSQFQILLLLRLLKPFLFLILSILALGLGWRFRVKGNRFPWGLSWVIILLPFVVHMLLYLIEYAHQIVLSALVLNSGLSTGLVALVLIEALLLFLALLPVAMQKDL